MNEVHFHICLWRTIKLIENKGHCGAHSLCSHFIQLNYMLKQLRMLLLRTQVLTLTDLFPATSIHLKKKF